MLSEKWSWFVFRIRLIKTLQRSYNLGKEIKLLFLSQHNSLGTEHTKNNRQNRIKVRCQNKKNRIKVQNTSNRVLGIFLFLSEQTLINTAPDFLDQIHTVSPPLDTLNPEAMSLQKSRGGCCCCCCCGFPLLIIAQNSSQLILPSCIRRSKTNIMTKTSFLERRRCFSLTYVIRVHI